MTAAGWSVIIAGLQLGVSGLIFWANNRSVKAANKQIAESKEQYEETRRLEVMPYLQVKIDNNKVVSMSDNKIIMPIYVTEPDINNAIRVAKYITLENIGRGTLHNAKLKYISNITESDEHEEKEIVIPPNAKMEAIASFISKRLYLDEKIDAKTDKCFLHVEFQDLLGNTYFQDLTVSIIITPSYIMPSRLSITAPKLVDYKNVPQTPNHNG